LVVQLINAKLYEEQFLKPVKEKVYIPKKLRSVYRNVLLGILKGKLMGSTSIKFLTLTTSALCVQQADYQSNQLNKDFDVFKHRLHRLSTQKLFQQGYLSKRQCSYFYGANTYDNNDSRPFSDIEYLKVRTKEGNGVLHIVMRSPYIPAQYIRDSWQDIHLSRVNDIRQIDTSTDAKQIAGYLIAQYLSGGQGDAHMHTSMSKNWIFPGAKQCWSDLKEKHLRNNSDYTYYYQWYNPYYRGNEYTAHFNDLMTDYTNHIKQSVDNPYYKYNPHPKPMVEYFVSPKPVCQSFYYRYAHRMQGMGIPFWKYPVYDFPPIFKIRHNLTETEEQKLNLEVLNTKYKHHKPNTYDSYLQECLGLDSIKQQKNKQLDEFYKTSQSSKLDDDGNYY
jgi:hypothetical protein